MNWKINIFYLFLFLSCEKDKINPTILDQQSYLIEAIDLKSIINKSNIKLLDFRKKEDYEKGHILGASHISRKDIEDKNYPYGGMMPNRLQIESLLSHLGISNNDTIIAYDDNGMCETARFWWLLQNYGYKKLKMLNGGIHEWINNNGELTKETPQVSKTNFKFEDVADMKYYVSKNEVQKALKNNVLIVDTRNIDEFSGKYLKKGATKSGRIPNSINIDWANNIDYHGSKRLKTIKDLESIYNKLNIKKTDSIILYCHSGVRSANTTFVLTQLLGYKNVMNYDGSWTEWSHFNDLPYENDFHLIN